MPPAERFADLLSQLRGCLERSERAFEGKQYSVLAVELRELLSLASRLQQRAKIMAEIELDEFGR